MLPLDSPMLSEEEYERLAEVELKKLLEALDALDDDRVQAELANGILTLDFSEGGRPIVINSHRAARQIWMAAERSAWHFDFRREPGAWVAEKSGEELWKTLETRVSERLGAPTALPRG